MEWNSGGAMAFGRKNPSRDGALEVVLKTEDARHCLDEVQHDFDELKEHGLMDDDTYARLKRGVHRLVELIDCYVRQGRA